MIYAVKGRPGCGKSFYATRKIAKALSDGRCVVTNVVLQPGWSERMARHDLSARLSGKSIDEIASGYRARLHALDSDDPEAMRELFRVRVAGTREGRVVAVLDEVHNWLNARTWNEGDRGEYVAWFTQHRKLGFDVYLLSQAIESVDAQIRRLIEYWVVLRNLKRWKVAGLTLVPVNLFVAITVWDGGPGSEQMIVKRESFRLSWHKDLYDTLGLSHTLAAEYARDDAIHLPKTSGVEPQGECLPPPAAPAAVIVSGVRETSGFTMPGVVARPVELEEFEGLEGDAEDATA